MASFVGFSKPFVAFFTGLKKNNSKTYFDAKREVYENVVKPEMAAFILAVGEGLKKISPYFMADPRVGGSMYRINRDIRFAANKMPYKTHCAAILKKSAFKKRFGEIEGEKLKKPPRGYGENHPHLELLKLKQYLLEEEEPVKKWIDDPRIVKRTLDSFRASAPLVQFLCTALNVPFVMP